MPRSTARISERHGSDVELLVEPLVGPSVHGVQTIALAGKTLLCARIHRRVLRFCDSGIDDEPSDNDSGT